MINVNIRKHSVYRVKGARRRERTCRSLAARESRESLANDAVSLQRVALAGRFLDPFVLTALLGELQRSCLYINPYTSNY